MTSKSTVLLMAAGLAAGCNSGQPAQMTTETPLTIEATLTSPDTLTIQVHDGDAPVSTDLWLYTLGEGEPAPLTGFTATPARKSPRLMLPATIAGSPSGLAPADDGRMNGLMAIGGTVTVTLPAPLAAPILIEAGVEDQRYAGALVVQPDGSPGTVPDGFGVPESHRQRSFSRDVAPILQLQCGTCHNPGGIEDANFYLVAGSRDQLVNDNFALKEQTEDCQEDNPDGGAALAACVQAITKTEYLVEPGAPAATDLLQRARPDEEAGSSTLGLAWFGGGNPKSRYNAKYGDRRMPSTTESNDPATWTNQPTVFDMSPIDYQILYDWVAQGALDN